MTLWMLIYLCAGNCSLQGQALIVYRSHADCETASLNYGMEFITTKDDPEDKWKVCDWTCPPSRQLPVPPYVKYTVCQQLLGAPEEPFNLSVTSQSTSTDKP